GQKILSLPLYNFPVSTPTSDQPDLYRKMSQLAREIFGQVLAESSVDKGFSRHVDYERGVLRVGEDLYDLNSYGRVLVISIGKAAHSLVSALEARAGGRFEGIIASSVAPESQLRGFRYFQGGHPTPNAESLRAASAILKSLEAQNAASLVI